MKNYTRIKCQLLFILKTCDVLWHVWNPSTWSLRQKYSEFKACCNYKRRSLIVNQTKKEKHQWSKSVNNLFLLLACFLSSISLSISLFVCSSVCLSIIYHLFLYLSSNYLSIYLILYNQTISSLSISSFYFLSINLHMYELPIIYLSIVYLLQSIYHLSSYSQLLRIISPVSCSGLNFKSMYHYINDITKL